MRTIGRVMLVLLSVALFGVMATTTALAATPVWQVCTNLEAKIGNFENAGCTKENTEGGYGLVETSEPQTVKLTALSLRLEDAKGELGAAVIVKCPVVKDGSGSIEGKVLIIKEVKAPSPSTECAGEGTGVLKACKTSSLEEIEGADLPWKVEVSASGGTYTGKIKADGNGEPGWKVKCAGVEDKCLSEAGKEEETSGTSGVVTEGVLLVLAKFKEAHAADCSVGGKEEGHVAGYQAIAGANGAGLAIKEEVVSQIVLVAGEPNFGGVKKGGEKTETFIFENPLNDALYRGAATLAGTLPSKYFRVEKTTCNVLKLATETCDVVVKFKPTNERPYSATLLVTAWVIGVFVPTTLQIKGTGTP
jgi:hypothetical protein